MSTPRKVDPKILSLVTPRLNRYIPLRPTPTQAAFLLVAAQEAFYGGAAGGGKTVALLMAALQYADVPGYAALLVRESFPMFEVPSGLISLSHEFLDDTDAIWNAGEHQWRFPSGATITFRHLQDANAEHNFQGAEFHFIGVDEVTDLAERQYRFLFSRLRRRSGSEIPLRMRAASNPYGRGLEWCHRRFVLGSNPQRVFIPARLEDNPHIDQEAYEASLHELGSVVYRQLRHGDWTVRPEGGMFQEAWFDKSIDHSELPDGLRLCRAWDLAATEPVHGSDPDHTVGMLLGRSREGITYVIDVKRIRSTPLRVEKLVRLTAESDRDWAGERGLNPPTIVMEQEPGSSGVTVIDHYRREVLSEFTIRGERATGTKDGRAMPVAARAEAGELVMCRGAWNGSFLDELVAFPHASHDDQVDALSSAFGHLAKNKERCMAMPVSIVRPSYWMGQDSYL